MKVFYLVNRYPSVSHTFIRREIHTLEKLGIDVQRVSIRPADANLVDPQDEQERQNTHVILAESTGQLLAKCLTEIISNIIGFIRALKLTLAMLWRAKRGLIRHAAYLVEASALHHLTRRERCDHLHAHFATNPVAVAALCRALGGPTYSFTVHTAEEYESAHRTSLAAKISGAEFVVAISQFTRSQLFRSCDYSEWSRIHVIHCGVDGDFLHHPKSPVPDVPRLVCLGRLSPEKGHLLLLEAVAALNGEGVDFDLVLIGDGPLRPVIESQILQYRLQHRVHLMGWANADQVKQELLAARALVLASFTEGLPVAIMEAFALRRPVISTYVAGIPELVRHLENGWLIPAGDVLALTDSLRGAVSADVAELSEMGEKGYRAVHAQHCVVTEVEKLAREFLRYAPSENGSTTIPRTLQRPNG